MTGMEIAGIVTGGLLGYWIISVVMDLDLGQQADKPVDHEAGANSDQQYQDANVGDQSAAEVNIAAQWFVILGVAENASKDELDQAYKLKIRQYHPDKVASLGVELQQLAEIKSREINLAYDYAMSLHASRQG